MELKFQNDKSQRIWIKNWQRKIIREINYEINQTNFLLGIDERPAMILSLYYNMRRKSGGRVGGSFDTISLVVWQLWKNEFCLSSPRTFLWSREKGNGGKGDSGRRSGVRKERRIIIERGRQGLEVEKYKISQAATSKVCPSRSACPLAYTSCSIRSPSSS